MNFSQVLTDNADFIRGFSSAILTIIIGSGLVVIGRGFFTKTTSGFYDDECREMEEHDKRMSRWMRDHPDD